MRSSKKAITVLLLIVIAIVGSFFTYKYFHNSSGSIVGAWQNEQGTVYFESDGTVQSDTEYGGTYSVSGNRLTLYRYMNTPILYSIQISGNTLTMTDIEYGYTYTYKRK